MSGSTPMISRGLPSSISVRPIADDSPPNFDSPVPRREDDRLGTARGSVGAREQPPEHAAARRASAARRR